MDLFNPLVTALMFVIILRLYYELEKSTKRVAELVDYILKEFGTVREEELIVKSSDMEIDEFDKKIQDLKDELAGVAMASGVMTTPTVADILDPRVYNLSKKEIEELEKQIERDGLEYSD